MTTDERGESWVPVPPEDDEERGEGWLPADDEREVERWLPTAAALREAPRGRTPEAGLAAFFDVDEAPPGAEVVVRPSMRAALDVPFKVLAVILLFFLPFGTTGFFVGMPAAIPGIIALIWTMTPALLFAFAPAIRLVYTRYIIDADGIRVRSQVLSATESRVPWEKVTAIEHRRTFFDRVLGIERLTVIAYGTRGATLSLVGLRDARALRDLTARKMRAHATAETIFSND